MKKGVKGERGKRVKGKDKRLSIFPFTLFPSSPLTPFFIPLSPLTLVFILLLAPVVRAQHNWTSYVDPFIGTGGHGHTFPGATMPFGMVQLSPDTRLTGWDGCSGYHYSDRIIYGFSHTHLSGTGISDYGDILLMPTVGEIYLNALDRDKTDKGYASQFSHQNEIARPGYYSVKLDDDNIFAELTATNRVGFHRYTFPKTNEANIILDLTHRDRVIDSKLIVVSNTRIEGFRRSDAWARDQLVYFVAEFSKPFKSYGIAVDEQLKQGLSQAEGKNIKSFFRFDAESGEPLLVKVALSSVSIEGARKNLAAELGGWNFDKVKADADSAWNTELNKIQVSGGTLSQLKNFYTALYHAQTVPNLFMDVDGQFRGRDLKAHRADGFTNYTVFSLWDTFRAAHPLYTIIEQQRTRDFIKTFLAQYKYGGRLPIWELAGNETDTMIGYHAVPVIADAAIKGIKGFDTEKAFEAMKHSAELKHYGLEDFVRRGYISSEDESESVSKTLEYAYDDWCIAMVARLLKREGDYKRFIRRAQSYKNLFDSETGFMRARKNGAFTEAFDPREVNFNFTEANSWQYSFFVPQDVSGLINLMGGKDKFVRKVDELFTTESATTGREQADITGLIGQYAHGNEPSHHMAYLYNFAGQPWKTQQRVRQILDQFYRPQPDGLIGNEDCGQMSAWYVLSAAGFYSVTPAAPFYVTGTPLFKEVRFNLENGRTFTIKAPAVSAKNIFIQSAMLNGQPYTKSYLTHASVMRGGTLIFTMGPKPNLKWGTNDKDIPVNAIADELIVPVPLIRSSGNTFRDRVSVQIQTSAPDLKVFYTTDGTEPDERSMPYSKPLIIERSTKIKAVAINIRGAKSFVVSSSYHQIPNRWSIRVLSKYATQYSAGGDLALIDGIRGGPNFRTGAWQGYQGQNFEAILDLGETRSISKLGAGFLQDMRSWIWMPTRVEFELSTDGINYTKAASILNDVSEHDEEVAVKDFSRAIPKQNARYIKVKADTYGTIPAWHAGAGGKAWIFIDEIIVE